MKQLKTESQRSGREWFLSLSQLYNKKERKIEKDKNNVGMMLKQPYFETLMFTDLGQFAKS